jgi:flagellar motor component MotA
MDPAAIVGVALAFVAVIVSMVMEGGTRCPSCSSRQSFGIGAAHPLRDRTA